MPTSLQGTMGKVSMEESFQVRPLFHYSDLYFEICLNFYDRLMIVSCIECMA